MSENNFSEINSLIEQIHSFSGDLVSLVTGLEDTLNSIQIPEGKADFAYSKQKDTANKLLQNFVLLTSDALHKQFETCSSFKRYYDNFVSQSTEFNQSILTESNRIGLLNGESLKRRAEESLIGEVRNFYSIYDSSIST